MESLTCLLNHNQRSDKVGSTLTTIATAFMLSLSLYTCTKFASMPIASL